MRLYRVRVISLLVHSLSSFPTFPTLFLVVPFLQLTVCVFGAYRDSTVPNQPAGAFWAVLNRLLIICQIILLILSEVGWPQKFFSRFFPVLGYDFGLGALGIIQCLCVPLSALLVYSLTCGLTATKQDWRSRALAPRRRLRACLRLLPLCARMPQHPPRAHLPRTREIQALDPLVARTRPQRAPHHRSTHHVGRVHAHRRLNGLRLCVRQIQERAAGERVRRDEPECGGAECGAVGHVRVRQAGREKGGAQRFLALEAVGDPPKVCALACVDAAGPEVVRVRFDGRMSALALPSPAPSTSILPTFLTMTTT